MNSNLKSVQIEDKILNIRNQNVILDSDVANLYGIETKDVNRAVKNNPDKFPEGYVISLKDKDLRDLRLKVFTANSNHDSRSKLLTTNMARVLPKAFTEKGLYMLATILKSKYL